MPRSTFFNFFLTITSEMKEQRAEMEEQSFLVASFRGSIATVGISYRNTGDCHEPNGSRNDDTEKRLPKAYNIFINL